MTFLSPAPNKATLLVHVAGMDLNPEQSPDHLVHLSGLGSKHLSVMDLAMMFTDFYRYLRWMCQGCSLPSYHILYIQGVPGGMCQTSGECSLS